MTTTAAGWLAGAVSVPLHLSNASAWAFHPAGNPA